MEMFMEAAQHPTEENTQLLWLSRHCGTECFRERDVYLKESQASHTWAFHATTGDSILAYAVEITGLRDGKVMGNLYELDYRQHAAKLEQQALPIQEVSLKFEDGTEGRYLYEQYNHGIYGMIAEHGKVVSRHYEPESEGALRGLLSVARQSRQKNRAATFKIKIGHKPSIRKQLAEAKNAAAPKKAPAKTKNHELEVG
ncbi:MAG: hypothetical protein HFF73_15530 [Oscillospiraceae bacterium]|nr:hypothetical protein [Oscillospiraceae bacterium]